MRYENTGALIKDQQTISLGPQATIQEAAEQMAAHRIGAIPVVASGELKGIFTGRDLPKPRCHERAAADRGMPGSGDDAESGNRGVGYPFIACARRRAFISAAKSSTVWSRRSISSCVAASIIIIPHLLAPFRHAFHG